MNAYYVYITSSQIVGPFSSYGMARLWGDKYIGTYQVFESVEPRVYEDDIDKPKAKRAAADIWRSLTDEERLSVHFGTSTEQDVFSKHRLSGSHSSALTWHYLQRLCDEWHTEVTAGGPRNALPRLPSSVPPKEGLQ